MRSAFDHRKRQLPALEPASPAAEAAPRSPRRIAVVAWPKDARDVRRADAGGTRWSGSADAVVGSFARWSIAPVDRLLAVSGGAFFDKS